MSTLIAVAGMLARGGSPSERSRRLLQTVGAALATWFLLGAAGVLGLHGRLDHHLGPISDPGTRGGTAFAFCLLVLPVAAFLHQAGRLASADRERRLSALRLAGATPAQVRLLGLAETGRTGLFGALAGAVVFLPVWWAVLPGPGISPILSVAAMILVVLVSALSGLLAGRHVVTTPLGVTRRARRGRPHWYGLVVLGIAVVILICAVLARAGFVILPARSFANGDLAIGALVFLLGLMLSASRLVWFSARVVGRRARSAETLLAARILEGDARPWGRAMSLVGLAVIVGTVTGMNAEEVLAGSHGLDPFWATSFALVGAALLVGIAVATAALLVHQAEYLLENGRVLADLHASGTSERELRRVLVRQALIAATPPCLAAALPGFALLFQTHITWEWRLLLVADGLVVACVGILGAVLAAVASWRRLRRVISPDRLRAE